MDRTPPSRAPLRARLAGLLLAAALVTAAALQLVAVREQSLTMDEPYHLLAGHQAWAHGTNALNLEHPPLVKMLAAWPLTREPAPFGERVTAEGPLTAEEALGGAQGLFEDPRVARRARLEGRLVLTVLFAWPWLLAVGLLGRALAGWRCGALLAAALGLSPAALPYLSLIQTDGAVALGFALTFLAGVLLVGQGPSTAATTGRSQGRPWALPALVAGVGLGLALAAKLSGILALPVVALAAVLAPAAVTGRRPTGGADPPRPLDLLHPLDLPRRLAFLGTACLLALGILWGSYGLANRAYHPDAGQAAVDHYASGRGTLVVGEDLLPWRERLLALESISPAAAQWAVGLLGVRAQSARGIYPSYAFGRVDSSGRWWYFPAAFVVRTPLVWLLATAMGVWGLWGLCRVRWRRSAGLSIDPSADPSPDPSPDSPADCRAGARGRVILFLAGGAGLYLAAALASSYNIGLRHLLPILPVLYLPGAWWASRRPGRTLAVVGLLLLEALLLTPHWMAATNTWWWGPANPTRIALGGSDGDYGQSLLSLVAEAQERRLTPLRVIHPTLTPAQLRTAEAEVRDRRGAGAAEAARIEVLRPEGRAARDLEPGWYAVSSQVEQLVPAILEAPPGKLYNAPTYRRIAERWEPLWRAVVEAGEDRGWIAGTYHLYRVGEGEALP